MGLAILTAAVLVMATALIHYEGLRLLSAWLARSPLPSRQKVLAAVLSIVPIHLVEIGLYALGYWFGATVTGIGGFGGDRDFVPLDYFTFSAEAFTTLGLGDIYPTGAMRLLPGIEAMNGLLLMGWSVSFTFFEMQRYWSDERASDR